MSKDQLAVGMLEAVDAFQPMFDAAKGVRAQLETEGWSPTAAETVATEWLLGCVRTAFRGMA